MLYLTAKQYDILVDDSLKFVNFYYLLMHRVYLKNQIINVNGNTDTIANLSCGGVA